MIYQLGAIKYGDEFLVQLLYVDKHGDPTGDKDEEATFEVAGTLSVNENGQLCLYAKEKGHGAGTPAARSTPKDDK